MKLKIKTFKKIFILNCAVILILLLLASCTQEAVPAYVSQTDAEIAEENTTEPDTDTVQTVQTETQTTEVSADTNNGITDGFAFVYNGATIYMDEPVSRVLNDLGEPLLKFESTEGCAFSGKIEIYTYAGIEISTYIKESTNEEKEEYVFLISFNDDSVSTAEGIYIGQTVSDMTAIYGTAQEESPGFYYNYIKNRTMLSFDVDGEEIISISYTLMTD